MNEPKLMGNGEGHTVLILTGAESLRIRHVLTNVEKALGRASGVNALDDFNRGIQRGTDRIKAEFDAEQKRRKEAKK